MQTNITARHFDVSDAIREHISKKIDHLQKYFNNLIEARITLSVEKYRNLAEITLLTKNLTLHGEDESDDMYASVDNAFEKIEKQIKRYAEKVKDHHSRSRNMEKEISMDVHLISGENFEENIQYPPKVIRTKRFAIKPMDIDEAVMQMDLLNQDILLFQNARTDNLNVVYRRKDGNYGLIEPEL